MEGPVDGFPVSPGERQRVPPLRACRESPSTFTAMSDGGHRPSLVSWDRGGDEIGSGDGRIPDRVVTRAWHCSCGWRGEVRLVDDRFHRPAGDAGGQLRTRRVRRSDRVARAEWDDHHHESDRLSEVSAVEAGVDRPDPGALEGVVRPPPRPSESTADGDRRPAVGSSPKVVLHSRRAERAQRRQQQEQEQEQEQLEVPRSAGPAAVPPSSLVSRAPSAPPVDPAEDTHPTEEIGRAAARVQQARAELAAAEASLAERVRRGRSCGLSWRAIAAEAGVDHRTARRLWSSGAQVDATF